MIEMRLRSKVSAEELESKVGKIVTDDDYNVLLTRSARVLKPDGKPLAVYLPGALSEDLLASSYDVLHALRKFETDNRGLASGSERVKYFEGSKRTRSKLVASTIAGSFDANSRFNYCRLTAWTGKENERFRTLYPLFQAIGQKFEEHVPDRFAAQMSQVAQTEADWLIEGTPFTTITVNNTYPTGVHTDKGDLDQGFSTLAVLRRGAYTGGCLVFPEYRLAVDMQHGDVLLMDAHEWHGNTAIVDATPDCDWGAEKADWRFSGLQPGTQHTIFRHACNDHYNALKDTPGLTLMERWPVMQHERISVVSYYRTKMVSCGTAEQEAEKAGISAEARTGMSMIDEMALEAASV